MRPLPSLCLLGLFFLIPSFAYADLAKALSCYADSNKNEECKLLLIGTIDAIYGFKVACPNGNTSYGSLIDAWKRDLKKYEDRQKLTTVKSMEKTMIEQGLKCQ